MKGAIKRVGKCQLLLCMKQCSFGKKSDSNTICGTCVQNVPLYT